MTPNSKKRRKRANINPEPKYSTSSSHTNFFFKEPPPDLFPSKSDFPNLLAVLVIAALVAVFCNYVVSIFNRQPKPFCRTNFEFLDPLSDFCEPCPNHGECYEGKLECATGYKQYGRLCVEDGDINQTAMKLVKLVETRVCEAYAQYLCKGTGTVWVREDEIWNNVDELNLGESYGVSTAVYMHAKNRTMESVDSLMEARETDNGMKELKCPDLLVENYLPITCGIRLWITTHAFILVLIFALLLGCISILYRIRQRYKLSTRAEELYDEVREILEEKAMISRSSKGEEESWIIVSWLRDHLLSPRERRDPSLWKKVEEFIQEDSRVDRYPKLVKGEAKVVWEWQAEGYLSSSGKKKKKSEGSKIMHQKETSLYSNHYVGEFRSGAAKKDISGNDSML